MVSPPPLLPLPTQRVLDRLTEIEAEFDANLNALNKDCEDALARFQTNLTLQLQALDAPWYLDLRPCSHLRAARELLPIVASTAVLTALLTTVVALLIQG